MIDITVGVDRAGGLAIQAFEHNMKQLIALTQAPVEDILRQQGRLFAVAAANYTERATPKGSGKTVETKFKKDIHDTVRRIYKPAKWAIGLIAREMGQHSAKRFKQQIRRRDIAKAQWMIDKSNISKYYQGRDVKIISWDGGAAHTRWVKKKGKAPVHMVMESPAINKFIKKKQKHAGSAKAGWARAAEMLGGSKNATRGIPAFAKKSYHKTRGFGRVRGHGSKAEVTVAHHGKYGFTKTSMNGLFRHRTNMMAKQIEKIIKAGNRQSARYQRASFRRTKLIFK